MTYRIATISKYPPYVSGHSHQAYWLGRELAEALGRPQHQLTYCGDVPPFYRDDRIVVHQVQPSRSCNPKVPDGHLLKALSARMAGLAHSSGVNVMLALYCDPHADVALRAARAARLLGHRATVVVSVEGSDVTSSLARHTADGEAAVLLGDIASADVIMAVSQRSAQLLMAAAERVLHPAAAADLAGRVVLRHPGLPPESFRRPAPAAIDRWRASHGFPADAQVISTFVRLVPEKGLGRILDIAEAARGRDDLVFAIAGSGPLGASLASEVERRGLRSVRLLGDLSQPQAHLLRAASAAALLPSQRAADWEETFCIAAIEYQALGVPVLASDSPGFAESCALDLFRCSDAVDAAGWLHRLDLLLQERPRFSETAARFAARFTAHRSAQTLLDAVRSADVVRLPVAARR